MLFKSNVSKFIRHNNIKAQNRNKDYYEKTEEDNEEPSDWTVTSAEESEYVDL
jgi:hypothetical protein